MGVSALKKWGGGGGGHDLPAPPAPPPMALIYIIQYTSMFDVTIMG